MLNIWFRAGFHDSILRVSHTTGIFCPSLVRCWCDCVGDVTLEEVYMLQGQSIEHLLSVYLQRPAPWLKYISDSMNYILISHCIVYINTHTHFPIFLRLYRFMLEDDKWCSFYRERQEEDRRRGDTMKQNESKQARLPRFIWQIKHSSSSIS